MEPVKFSYVTDYPMIGAIAREECVTLLAHLKQQGYLSERQSQYDLALTVKGWELLEPTAAGGLPGLCFVAMSFDPSLDVAYSDAILPAIEKDCGFHACRIDKSHHGEKICDRILTDIRRSQFVVADFTLHKGGVYFEAGYALALGRPVIWMCREDHFDRLPRVGDKPSKWIDRTHDVSRS